MDLGGKQHQAFMFDSVGLRFVKEAGAFWTNTEFASLGLMESTATAGQESATPM